MNSKIFTIKKTGKGYVVSWEGYGSLTTMPKIVRMISFAVQAGAQELVLINKARSVHVNSGLFLRYDDVMPVAEEIVKIIAWHLPQSNVDPEIDAVAFDNLECAEKFVELCDQHITWNILKNKTHE